LNDAAITSSLERFDLEKISAPTLIVSVADDQFGTFAGARYSAEHIPDARFVGYATGGHVWAGHHDDLVSLLAAFLRQSPAQPDSSSTRNVMAPPPAAAPTTLQPAALTMRPF
jgi:2-hydroxy-6-oxonona-2,4-dienedioate hydrolase